MTFTLVEQKRLLVAVVCTADSTGWWPICNLLADSPAVHSVRARDADVIYVMWSGDPNSIPGLWARVPPSHRIHRSATPLMKQFNPGPQTTIFASVGVQQVRIFTHYIK